MLHKFSDVSKSGRCGVNVSVCVALQQAGDLFRVYPALAQLWLQQPCDHKTDSAGSKDGQMEGKLTFVCFSLPIFST